MTEVLVERHWATPLADADIQHLFEITGGCLDIHRVNGLLLGADSTQTCRIQRNSTKFHVRCHAGFHARRAKLLLPGTDPGLSFTHYEEHSK